MLMCKLLVVVRGQIPISNYNEVISILLKFGFCHLNIEISIEDILKFLGDAW